MYSQKLLDRRISHVHNQPTLMPETAKPSSSIMHRLIDQTLKSVNIKRVSALSCVTIDSSDVLNIKSRRVKTFVSKEMTFIGNRLTVCCVTNVGATARPVRANQTLKCQTDNVEITHRMTPSAFAQTVGRLSVWGTCNDKQTGPSSMCLAQRRATSDL